MIILPEESSLDLGRFERMIGDKLSSSYKLFWFLGVFKEVISGNDIIPFRRIVCRMICESWYPLIKFHLNFGWNDRLYEVAMYIHSKYDIPQDITEKDLLYFLENTIDIELEKHITKFYDLVPYRLLAPFFLKN